MLRVVSIVALAVVKAAPDSGRSHFGSRCGSNQELYVWGLVQALSVHDMGSLNSAMLRITAQWRAAGYPLVSDAPPGWLPLRIHNSPAHWEVCHVLEGRIPRESVSKEAAQYLALAERNAVVYVESQGGFYIPCAAFIADDTKVAEVAALRAACDAMRCKLAAATAPCDKCKELEVRTAHLSKTLDLLSNRVQDVTRERDEALKVLKESESARADVETKLAAQVVRSPYFNDGGRPSTQEGARPKSEAVDLSMKDDAISEPGQPHTLEAKAVAYASNPVAWSSNRPSTQATELCKANIDLTECHNLVGLRGTEIAEAEAALSRALAEKDTLTASLKEAAEVQETMRGIAKSFDCIFPEIKILECSPGTQALIMSSTLSQVANIAKFGPRALGDVAVMAEARFYRAVLGCFNSVRSTSRMIASAPSALAQITCRTRANHAYNLREG